VECVDISPFLDGGSISTRRRTNYAAYAAPMADKEAPDAPIMSIASKQERSAKWVYLLIFLALKFRNEPWPVL
jgi:hypothetical protein